jgi:PTS system cellobiose-specific IIC component
VYALIAFIIHWSHQVNINAYHPLISGLIVYLMVSVTLQSTPSGWTLDPQYLGYSGLLTAFVVGVVAVGAHRLAHRIHLKWFSTTRHSEHLAQPLEAFATTVILILGAFVSRWLLGDAGIVFPHWVEGQVAGWLTLTESIWTLVTVIALVRLFQFIGLDGRGLLALTLLPIMVMASAQNLEAYLYDKALPHILASGFLFFDTGVLPLIIAQLLFGKHPQRRTAAKLGLLPALFNLPETTLTGIPVVFNGTLLLPFMFTGITGITLAYSAMSFFWVNKPLIALSALVPSPLGVVASTLDWRALVLYMFILLINVLIYWPFIVRMERQTQASEVQSDANVLN